MLHLHWFWHLSQVVKLLTSSSVSGIVKDIAFDFEIDLMANVVDGIAENVGQSSTERGKG